LLTELLGYPLFPGADPRYTAGLHPREARARLRPTPQTLSFAVRLLPGPCSLSDPITSHHKASARGAVASGRFFRAFARLTLKDIFGVPSFRAVETNQPTTILNGEMIHG